MLPRSVGVSPVAELNQLLEELLWLVVVGAVEESMGLCRRCFTVDSVSLPRTSLPRTVPARLCNVDHCTPQFSPGLLMLLLVVVVVVVVVVVGARGVFVAAPGVARWWRWWERCFGDGPLPLPFLWVVLLLGLLLFRRGVGCVDRVLVVNVVDEELEEKEWGGGRFILFAVSGAGGDACSSNEGSLEVRLGLWIGVGGLHSGRIKSCICRRETRMDRHRDNER